MPIPSADYFANLDNSNPINTDLGSDTDTTFRNILTSCKQQGPNWTGAITASHTELNKLDGATASTADLNTVNGESSRPGTYVKGDTGMVMTFLQSSAPTGWVITTAFDGRMLCTKGTIDGSTRSGGSTGGSSDPGINDRLMQHRHHVVKNDSTSSTVTLTGSNYLIRQYTGGGDSAYAAQGSPQGPDIGLSSQEGNTAVGYRPLWATTIACTMS